MSCFWVAAVNDALDAALWVAAIELAHLEKFAKICLKYFAKIRLENVAKIHLVNLAEICSENFEEIRLEILQKTI